MQFDDTETPTETTPFPSGFFEYSVWYYLTDRFALRGEPSNDALKKGDSPALTGAVTVACAGTEG